VTQPVHLLGLAKVRRGLVVTVVLFVCLIAARYLPQMSHRPLWVLLAYPLFDSALWIGTAFFIFAVIERRLAAPPQPRLVALPLAALSIASLALGLISVRALFESFADGGSFEAAFVSDMPDIFFTGVFYVAIITGIGYGLHTWAADEQRRAEAAELDVAIARAELKAAAGRLQPDLINVALGRISAVMPASGAQAQHLIGDLGELLHYLLLYPTSALVTLGEELDYVERFLRFQQAILPGHVDYAITASEEARARRIPNLAVHALVQQAMSRSTHSRIDISVTAATDGDGVKVSVHERVLHVAGEPVPELTVDFRDVHDRLRRFCGDDFDLRVVPHSGGTEWKVELALPAA
jgi:hypothetical protein